MEIYNLREDDWDAVIRLGNKVQGENYLDFREIEKIFFKGLAKGLNCSYVAYDGERGKGGKLIGFRLTYGPGNWEIDKWCTIRQWKVPPEKVCYLKSLHVEKEYRKQGIGIKLLNKSIDTVKQMGGVAAVAHIWMESPNGGAMKYFSKVGGQFIKLHKNRWLEDCITSNYRCVYHGDYCVCSASEMILYFGEQENE